MKDRFIIDYLDENTFRKYERSLKKYSMVAYKKLMVDFYPKLRNGKFVGDLISSDIEKQTETYDLRLPTDPLFAKVYGEVKLNYTVYKNNNTVILNNLEPKEILLDGHKSELTAYKGILISKANAQEEMFKIDLLCRLEGREDKYNYFDSTLKNGSKKSSGHISNDELKTNINNCELDKKLESLKNNLDDVKEKNEEKSETTSNVRRNEINSQYNNSDVRKGCATIIIIAAIIIFIVFLLTL